MSDKSISLRIFVVLPNNKKVIIKLQLEELKDYPTFFVNIRKWRTIEGPEKKYKYLSVKNG